MSTADVMVKAIAPLTLSKKGSTAGISLTVGLITTLNASHTTALMIHVHGVSVFSRHLMQLQQLKLFKWLRKQLGQGMAISRHSIAEFYLVHNLEKYLLGSH